MTLADVKSAEWQLAASGIGQVVEGTDDVNQCLAVIAATIPGTDPLRPLFGCDLYKFIDQPTTTAAPLMAAALADAFAMWEPRITVNRVVYQIVDREQKVRFNISWRFKIGFLQGEADLLVGLLDSQLNAPGIDVFSPYLSAVLSTQLLQPITTQSGEGLAP